MPASVKLYDPSKVNAAYRLRFTWTGWLSEGAEQSWPTNLSETIKPLWETDGLRCLQASRQADQVKLVFSAQPIVSPILLATRAKGRLDYALRTQAIPHRFRRKLAVRSLGENTRDEVGQYLASQIEAAQFVDPRFESLLKDYTMHFPCIDLKLPTNVLSGRYWYDLHIVLVTASRYRFVDMKSLATIRDASIATAYTESYGLSRLSVMPDHLHLLLRGKLDQSPANIVASFQNGIADAFGGVRIWQDSFYVGSVGEYNMNAIRNRFS